jgi:tetratricopeptide (TPR) repeat protein
MTESLLLSVASTAADALIKGLAARARGYVLGSEEERALHGVFERALGVALEKTAVNVDQETVYVMESVFGRWFSDAEVQDELLDCVVGVRQPSAELLHCRFEKLGFEEETLPLELDRIIYAFRDAAEQELEAEIRLKDSVLSNMVAQGRLKMILEDLRPSGADLSDHRQGTLPLRPDLLVGRDRDVEELLRLLNSATSGTRSETSGATVSEPRTVAIVGLPGVGKTSVAAHLCVREELLDLFPAGVLWASLGPSPDLTSILARWSRSVGGPELDRSSSVEEASLRLTAFMQGKKMLMVTDDVFEAKHVAALNVLIEGAILVTSRAPEVASELTLTPGRVYELQVLREEESVKLLEQLAPSLAAEDPHLFRELSRELDGLPLALRVAGRLLEEEVGYGWGIAELLEELRDGKRLLESKAPADTGGFRGMVSPTVEVLLRTSYERLDETTREAARRLGIMAAKPSTFDVEASEAVWGSEDSRETMRTLVRRGLVEKAGVGSFMMHRVLIMFAKRLLGQDPAEMYDAGKRHSDHFLRVLKQATELYFEDARRWALMLGTNWENLRRGWAWAVSYSGEDVDPARLCVDYMDAGERWFTLHLSPEEHASWAREALESARLLDDIPAEAMNLIRLGNAYARVGRYQEAKEVSETALELYREIGDKAGEGAALNSLGACHQTLGDTASAEQCYQGQILIAGELGDPQGEARSRGNLGVLYREAGKHEEAIREISAAARIFEEIGDRREEAGAWANLGTVYLEKGDLDRAEQEQEKYLRMARDLGDRDSECRALGNLGNVQWARGQYEAATESYGEALSLDRELRNPLHEIATLRRIASVQAQLGNTEEARDSYERALAIREAVLGLEHKDVFAGYHELGSLLAARELYDEAQPYLERALAISQKVHGENHQDTAMTLNRLADVMIWRGDLDGALSLHKRELAIAERILSEDDPQTAWCLGNVATVLVLQDRYPEARPLLERAARICEGAFGDVHPATAGTLDNLANVLAAQGHFEEARPLYERSLNIRLQTFGQQHPETAISEYNLANVLRELDLVAEALTHQERAVIAFQDTLGDNHPATATSLHHLADLLRMRGRHGEARPYLARVLAAGEAVFGIEHPFTQRVRQDLRDWDST